MTANITFGEFHHSWAISHISLIWLAAESGDSWKTPTYSNSSKIGIKESLMGDIYVSQKITVGILR